MHTGHFPYSGSAEAPEPTHCNVHGTAVPSWRRSWVSRTQGESPPMQAYGLGGGSCFASMMRLWPAGFAGGAGATSATFGHGLGAAEGEGTMTTGEGATGAASIRDGCLKAWLPLAPAPLRSVADAAVPCVRSTAWGEVEPPVRARVKATPRAKLAASVMMLAPFLRQLPSWCRCPAMLSLALAWRLLLFHVTDRNACPVPLSQLTHFTCTCVSRNLSIQSICGILFLLSSGARPARLPENRWVANKHVRRVH